MLDKIPGVLADSSLISSNSIRIMDEFGFIYIEDHCLTLEDRDFMDRIIKAQDIDINTYPYVLVRFKGYYTVPLRNPGEISELIYPYAVSIFKKSFNLKSYVLNEFKLDINLNNECIYRVIWDDEDIDTVIIEFQTIPESILFDRVKITIDLDFINSLPEEIQGAEVSDIINAKVIDKLLGVES